MAYQTGKRTPLLQSYEEWVFLHCKRLFTFRNPQPTIGKMDPKRRFKNWGILNGSPVVFS